MLLTLSIFTGKPSLLKEINSGLTPISILEKLELSIFEFKVSIFVPLTATAPLLISLGRGLVRSDVNVIMFDEPLTVIDPHLKWVLRSKLKELHQKIKRTMIYVTHDQTEALTFADQVVVMHEGQIVQTGTPVELFEKPKHTFVGHFIGSPGMNILPSDIFCFPSAVKPEALLCNVEVSSNISAISLTFLVISSSGIFSVSQWEC